MVNQKLRKSKPRNSRNACIKIGLLSCYKKICPNDWNSLILFIFIFVDRIDHPGCSRISFWQQVPTILTPQCGQKNGVKIGSKNSTIQGGPQWLFSLDIIQKLLRPFCCPSNSKYRKFANSSNVWVSSTSYLA